MKVTTFWVLIIIALSSLISGCTIMLASSIPMSKSFYGSSKVGIVYMDTILVEEKEKESVLREKNPIFTGSFMKHEKYIKPLLALAPDINSKKRFTNHIEKVLKSKNKQFKFVDEMDFKNLKRFKGATGGNKKYYKLDLTKLKSKYDVDELMIVYVNYGLSVTYIYKGTTEYQKSAYSLNHFTIVNLQDHSILFEEIGYSMEIIPPKSDVPPNYENLKTPIIKALDKSSLSIISKF